MDLRTVENAMDPWDVFFFWGGAKWDNPQSSNIRHSAVLWCFFVQGIIWPIFFWQNWVMFGANEGICSIQYMEHLGWMHGSLGFSQSNFLSAVAKSAWCSNQVFIQYLVGYGRLFSCLTRPMTHEECTTNFISCIHSLVGDLPRLVIHMSSFMGPIRFLLFTIRV